MIGHNNPPAHEAFAMALEDAYTTAQDFLDGKPLATQGQADAVGRIVSEVKALRKDIDSTRAAEKKPHDDAGKEVQARYKPLLERADVVIAAAQKPLTAFLQAQANEQAETARITREEADRKAQEAIEASRSVNSMEDIERARELEKEADKANRDANRASKAKAHVAGGDRAIGLRSYKVVTVTDHRAALNWLAKRDPAALTAFIDEYAQSNAPTRPMDGVEVTTDKRAV